MKKENKIYTITYNTNSINPNDRWKIICDKEEFLVSNIIIDSSVKNCENFIEDSENKYRITCEGYLEIEANLAHIQVKRNDNSIKRHVYKTITYRILSSIIGFFLIYLITGSIEIGGFFSLIELIYKPIQYYIHERIWYKFGKI